MEYKVVSRSALYESDDEPSDAEVYLPALEFDEVEIPAEKGNFSVAPANAQASEPQVSDSADDEAFAFRLFAGDSADTKISLREDADDEKIVNERPTEFYFSKYSAEQEAQFAAAAVELSESTYFLWSSPEAAVGGGAKVLDVTAYNAKIDLDRTRHRRRREGKKKRENKAASRERRQAREKEQKRLEKEEKRRKYGGTAHKPRRKPKPKPQPAPAKPKFRTE